VVRHLFDYLDVDGDGKLSRTELGRAPSADQWRQLTRAARDLEPDAAPPFAALARGKDHVSFADLSAFYRGSTAGPLLGDYQWPTRKGDPLSDRLFALLDRNGDGKLSRAELLDAPAQLSRLDLDNDEMVTAGEIMDFRGGYYIERALNQGP